MSRLVSYILLTIVMFIWGLNVVAVKFLVEHFPPIAMQGFRLLIAGVVAMTFLYFFKELRKMSKKEWIYMTLAGVLGQFCHQGLLAIGLMKTTASNGALILGLIPLTTTILAIIFLNDRITWLRTIGIVVGFTGVGIVVLQNNGEVGAVSSGDLIVFLAMIVQAASFILIKKMSTTLSPKQMTASMLLVGALLLLVTSALFEPQSFERMASGTAMIWSILLLSAVIATGLCHIIYNVAIQQIGAGQTAIFNNFVPFFALIGAFIFLGETILLSQIFGFILIVGGVFLGIGYVDVKKAKVTSNEE
ncbi:DMT family transporter [Anaerobacillus sp. MEB173]|uniref:DMT family transporter n=1 Tax=Anaerobacillus sp. MEB173 TaxID=3383345 RepID=UPI003F8F142B